MSRKLLKNLNFAQILNENFDDCITESGKNLVNSYRSYLYSKNDTYNLVNNFVNEAKSCAHDPGVSKILSNIEKYLNENKVSWNLASITESLLNNENMSSYASMVKGYASHMSNVLENNDESSMVKMIYTGSLKNMNFIPEYRTLFNSVYQEKVTECNTIGYTVYNPMSYVFINENKDQFISINIFNRQLTYKLENGTDNITEAVCQDTKFNKVNKLLTKYSNYINENHNIKLSFGTAKKINYDFEINESELKLNDKTFDIHDLAHIGEEFNRVSMTISNLTEKLQFNSLCKDIITLCENIDNIFVLDNVKLLNSVKNDVLCIIESNDTVRIDSFNNIKNGNVSKTVRSIDEAIVEVKKLANIDLTKLYEKKEDKYVNKYVNENNLVESKKSSIYTTLTNESKQKFETKTSSTNSITDLLFNSQCDKFINTMECVTEAAQSMVNKYKAIIATKPITYTLVNNFINEASKYTFDTVINEALSALTDYINKNNVSWRLASVCESISNNNNVYNYISKIGIEQVEKLLEMKESDVISYIKAGALKSVQYIPEFRSICKDVYRSSIYESSKMNKQYEIVHPISYVHINENDNSQYFMTNGKTYKVSENKIEESVCDDKIFNEVNHILSTAFTSSETHLITEMQGMHHDKCTFTINVDEKSISVYRPTTDATLIKTINEKFDNVEKFNDWSKIFSRALSGNEKFRFMNICESVNKVYEHIDNIFLIDNTSVIVTENAVLSIIEGKDNILFNVIKTANNMPSSSTPYNYMSEAINQALKITGINLSEHFQDRINEDAVKMNKDIDDAEIKEAVESTRSEQIKIRKRKLAMLAEKYKNDPARIAVLNKIAEDLKVLES